MAKQLIAILGGKGMLGTDLAKACRRRGFGVRVLDLPEFDITNVDKVKEAVDSADMIVNCAAYTNVDNAEVEPEIAYKINAAAAGRLGELAAKAKKWLLHISTDFVFDGFSKTPYTETDAPNPINEYGKTKLAGEQMLAEAGGSHCILRLQWTYGLAGNNFPKKLITLAKSGWDIEVIDDQIGSPTATVEAAGAICDLAARQPEGVFHFAAEGCATRYDIAKFVFDTLSLNVKLAPCKTSDFASPAKRPLSSRFDCTKIRSLLSRPIKHWQGPLEHFLRQL